MELFSASRCKSSATGGHGSTAGPDWEVLGSDQLELVAIILLLVSEV